MRLPHSLVWILLGLSLGLVLLAQEPSANLRQADADYREGVEALNRNDLETAQSKFEAVMRLAPAAEQGHSALGAVLVREGQWAAGTRELERAFAIKPSDSAAQLNLAMVYAQSGAPTRRRFRFFRKLKLKRERQASSADGNSLMRIRSIARRQSGKHKRAITEMKAAVAQEDRNAELHDELGSLYAIGKRLGYRQSSSFQRRFA